MIETRRLTRRFGELLAVDRLDLDVARGECLGFLGPNGAGKTTTVRMLCALIAPSEGSARVAGHDVVREADQVRRKVGILTETPGLYDRLSARRNLELFGELYGVDDVAGQVRRYLALLGLWERRDDPAGTFSKGMRQKLAICRALLHEPPILFLDEPTSALDPEAARLVRDFVGELKSQGRTIFLCTHNLEEADQLCDRVALFRNRLLVVDTAASLRHQTYGRQVEVRLRELRPEHDAAVRALGLPVELAAVGATLRLRADDPDAITPAVVRALVLAGAEVQAVTPIEHSLERVYLEIMGGQP
ncbi:ABC transporter ATP-binding protein [Myxococcota bacterium]|nr:ABC transporter ATP-binding protein [Myxococcota bacterium]